ncbi:MAG TPA: hypothetical protein VK787_09120 [Puia sp.]|jgi:hypothetical protein|nr:hypothetical protein [Puia sp.]
MEVHHHPHIEKKRFKEYFLEFIMIFLAVTLGFFAENLRESFGDDHKKHQYAKTLVADIKLDTIACHQIVANANYYITNYDSLLRLLNTKNASVRSLYYFFVPTNQYIIFNSINSTIDQLKSTGQLRLFEDEHASDAINSYYQQSKFVESYFNTYLKYFDEYHKDAFELFAYSQIGSAISDPDELLDSAKYLQLLDDDYKLRQKVYSKLFMLKIISAYYIDIINKLKDQGVNCINFLKKEYNIEDELK